MLEYSGHNKKMLVWELILLLCIVSSCTNVAANNDDGNSVAFVMDFTASMSDKLPTIKAALNSILLEREALKLKLILVVVYDADVKSFIAKTAAELLKHLEQVPVAKPSGDCAESILAGVIEALKLSYNHSPVYVFTDSNVKDLQREPEVYLWLQKKHCQVYTILAGYCSSPKYDTQEALEKEPSFAAYRRISSVSNGQRFLTPAGDTENDFLNNYREQVNLGLDSLKQRVKAETPRSISTIYQWRTEHTEVRVDERVYNASYVVEPGTQAFTITITGSNPQIVFLQNPVGNVAQAEELETLKNPTTLIVTVAVPVPGEWKVKFKFSGHGSLTVRTVSNKTLVEQSHVDDFYFVPPEKKTEPIKKTKPDQPVFLYIRIKGNGVVKKIRFITSEGKVLQESNNVKPGQSSGEFLAENLKIPSMTFMITIDGTFPDGSKFQRVVQVAATITTTENIVKANVGVNIKTTVVNGFAWNSKTRHVKQAGSTKPAAVDKTHNMFAWFSMDDGTGTPKKAVLQDASNSQVIGTATKIVKGKNRGEFYAGPFALVAGTCNLIDRAQLWI